MLQIKRPTDGDGGASKSLYDTSNSQSFPDLQGACHAIEAGLTELPDACDMATILRQRLDRPGRLWLAASCMLALSPDDADQLADAVKADLPCAGEPPVAFLSLQDEAEAWATFASRAERCHYLAAIWRELGADDRRRFMRKVL